MRGMPDVARADRGILCRRMNEGFAATPDSLLFGAQSDIARETAARLDRRAARLAGRLPPAERDALLERFVDEFMRDNPVAESDGADNTTLAWLEFLRENGVEPAYAVGSIAEVLADVNDRVSGQKQQLSNSVGWSKDLIEMRLAQDSLRDRIGAQLDSLDRNFRRMVAVAEHLPEISDRVLEELNEQATQLLWTMDVSVDNAFSGFDRQRMELQSYVSRERGALVEQLRTTGEDLLSTAFDAVLQCFQILNNFDIPVGVEFPQGELPADIPSATQWTSATDPAGRTIYYRTMYDSTIRSIDLRAIDFGQVRYRSEPLDEVRRQPVVPVRIG